ncbi:MAG: DNA polymerase III subunit alpha [Anaerolineae bacterium]|nr:DNA polymerase III subunit alpha [Anaerolineae bacterium]
MADFVHLHVHSEYSLLDGLSSCRELAERAAELGMPALALTDHGAMYGAVQFYKACQSVGIKPLIGMEAYLAPRSRHDRDSQLDRKAYHLELLAQNETGYRNLMRLATIAQLEGFYYKPRIDRETLAAYADGLIVLSGCGSSELAHLILEGRLEEARRVMDWYREVFPGRYFLELQEHDLPDLTKVNRQLVAFARELSLPLVATNDVHYTNRADSATHDVLLCIQTGKTVTEPNRMRMDNDSFYLRSGEEMAALFAEVPEALTNTLRVAEMCDLTLEFGRYHLPVFEVPPGHDPQSYLRHLCEQGLHQRYPVITTEIRQRLDYELDIIHRMGFDTYFLIVWDLCRFAREQGIWWNVRGSGASSIVAYCLGITNLDPLKHNLIFERFLNLGRVTMPDIDLDYPDDQRNLMIRYTIEKYGQEQVAQIITFGTMGAKAAIRDVGRALDYPLTEVDRIARLVPAGPKVTLESALEEVPELRQEYETQPHVRRLIDTARALEGNIRHASTHAAGVIVSDVPLVNYAPLHRPTRGGEGEDEIGVVTQYTMEELEELGLLKIDFLGLATLTLMRRACELIRQRHGVELNLYNIPTDDPAIYELLSRGEVMGIFQVEGEGMRRVLMKMQPTAFDHIIATLSLYRPGPMEYIDDYIDRMHGLKPVEYRHPALEPILSETYAIIVYQEQIIRILTDLAGYSASEADLVRRAVGKKKKAELLKHRESFIAGAARHSNIPEDVASAIFDDIEYFARYGFNKCLPGDVEILDAATGRLVRIEELVNSPSRLSRVLTCDIASLRLQPAPVTDVFDNGVRPVFRLTTASGRRIEATANHPFYTPQGWRRLDELKRGSHIAVPARLPIDGTGEEWPEHQLIALAHLVTGGELERSEAAYYLPRHDALLDSFIAALKKFENTDCAVEQRNGQKVVRIRPIHPGEERGLVHWLKQLGLWGTPASQRELPTGVFTLGQQPLALLLGHLWSAGGRVGMRNGKPYACYVTPSERLAVQIQHLLLRLGIVSKLQRHGARSKFQVHIAGEEGIRRLVNAGVLPPTAVSGLITDLSAQDPPQSDLYWDKVLTIEYAGEKRTYDLSIAGTHNFVANDILVHNSHAADYAVLTCQTAYLKARYPVEYMAALLTVERNNTEKVGLLIAECRRMGIEVLPPDINRSELDFTIEEQEDGKPAIRFGLAAVKNVGEGPVQAILNARRAGGPFRDLDDFCRRVDMRQVNRRALESLIKVGALRPFGTRSQLLAALDRIVGLSASLHRAKDVGQMSLFGEATGCYLGVEDVLTSPLAAVPEVSQRDILAWEKELVGVYISEHPLTGALNRLRDVITAYAGTLSAEANGQQVVVVGMVQHVRRHTTQKGDEMAFVTLEDLQGTCDVVVFPRVWKESRHLWQPERILVIGGKVDASRRDTPSLLCDWVKPPEEVIVPADHSQQPSAATPPAPPSRKVHTVRVTLVRSGEQARDVEVLRRVHSLLVGNPGQDHFVIRLTGGPHNQAVELAFPNNTTRYTPELERQLSAIAGVGGVQVEEGIA